MKSFIQEYLGDQTTEENKDVEASKSTDKQKKQRENVIDIRSRERTPSKKGKSGNAPVSEIPERSRTAKRERRSMIAEINNIVINDVGDDFYALGLDILILRRVRLCPELLSHFDKIVSSLKEYESRFGSFDSDDFKAMETELTKLQQKVESRSKSSS